MKNSIKKISIRGRMYFCLVCLQNAFKQNNINNGESNLIINIIKEFLESNNLSDWEELANNIQPINILDEKFNINDFSFEHKLVLKLKIFYEHIPAYLTEMIDYTLDVGLNNLYGGTGEYSPLTLEPVLKIIDLCKENSIEFPDINNFLQYSYQDDDGWGFPIQLN
ncbi:hypothetical protein ETU08_07650 [Apibacter muscae]|uniref:Uncharacterized protein n=1 Tax=Apibacter muscae TaxID=2509004 RepID=A0A563DAG6_9FLAO|nr:hypothetical protein [Apibacter muscae]TWP27059.1 hypothetical protein ETU09_08035 [Apibacter muscae]TWP29366.1 hypothetical protein ETU08_07650 [Apibacter muscae]